MEQAKTWLTKTNKGTNREYNQLIQANEDTSHDKETQ